MRLAELYHSQEPLALGQVSITNEGETFFILEKNGRIVDDFPVSEKALKRWRTRITPQKDKLQEIDETIMHWFQVDWEGNNHPISDPENKLPLFRFAEKIGIDAAKARYIIDRQFAHDLPTYSSLTSSTKLACKFVEEFVGVYYLYRHDNISQTSFTNHPQGVLLRCTVSIRYPVPYSPHDSEKYGVSRVRCKINIPSMNSHISKPFKYDGYVSKKGKNWWHWLLQMRPRGSTNDDQEDLVLMYTEKPKTDAAGHIIACGVMVTQNQDKEMMPTISTICLIKNKDVTLERATIMSGVNSTPMKNFPKSLDTYYKCVPKDEKRIMRDELSIIDLSDSSSWNDLDKIAVEKTFCGGIKVNLKGLHI